jgi:hypothetical protein
MEAAWLAASAAVAAAVVGPAASVYVARRQARTAEAIARAQLNATLVSAKRQEWIDKLRDVIADFQATLHRVGFRGAHSIEMEADEEHVQKAMHLRYRCALFINPNERDHEELLILMDQALSFAYVPGREGMHQMAEVQRKIDELAQRILKREWERVKAGEQGALLPSTTESVAIAVRDA